MTNIKKIKLFFLSLCILYFSYPVSGQIIEGIVELAAENLASNAVEIIASDVCCGDPGCWYFMYDILLQEAWYHHQDLLERKETIPRITSLELFVKGGYNPLEYYLFIPRIRGNWGFFSTDFRIFSIYEPVLKNTNGSNIDTYQTLDWQIFQLNLIVLPNFHLRSGTGFMLEQTTGISFNEHTISADIYFDKKLAFLQPSNITSEVRLAPDYNTGEIPRLEFSAMGNYKLNNATGVNIYLSLGGMYAIYYRTVEVWALQAGLNMRIE